ncbi:mutT/nudix family protein [Planococcus antarcticus DSM 14505]|uniref:MutT/nudix family protein n=1 Tax=Planococcus antarcticus DSM 14505 TaxID=1185653 RepID=A0AA87IN70_9BACL|nr:NUDIX hydrolase [Planococcus antarcticus]EIM07237.1 mutT/nudix family protein [Planococcus antarcticus DSM 14505]
MEMSNWKGAAGVCVNQNNEVLLVLQGVPGEDKKWTVPAGGVEEGETAEQCCSREFFEETGLTVRVLEKLNTRTGEYEDSAVSFEITYFKVEVIGGEIALREGDEWIADVAWKSISELGELEMAYPDDAALIESLTVH